MEYLDKWETIERFIDNGRNLDKEQIIYLLNRCPVLDIVRCSECVYYTKPEWSVVPRCVRDEEAALLRNPSDFCSKGERREE